MFRTNGIYADLICGHFQDFCLLFERVSFNFYQLVDLHIVLKILLSNPLNIQLELQVFLAAKAWLEHNLARRELALCSSKAVLPIDGVTLYQRVLRTVRFLVLNKNFKNHLFASSSNAKWRHLGGSYQNKSNQVFRSLLCLQRASCYQLWKRCQTKPNKYS